MFAELKARMLALRKYISIFRDGSLSIEHGGGGGWKIFKELSKDFRPQHSGI